MTRGSSNLPTESSAPFDGDEDWYDRPSPRDCLTLLGTHQASRARPRRRRLLVSVTLPTSALERLTRFPPALLPGYSQVTAPVPLL
jgi:hypothetical protein